MSSGRIVIDIGCTKSKQRPVLQIPGPVYYTNRKHRLTTYRSEYHEDRHLNVEAGRYVVDYADAEVGQHEVEPLPGDAW